MSLYSQDFDRIVEHHNLTCFGAEPHDEGDGHVQDGSSGNGETGTGPCGLCLVLGNEGQGLSAEALSRCRSLTIPMAGRMESLNVSHAGAILMFALSDGAGQVIDSLKLHTQQT